MRLLEFDPTSRLCLICGSTRLKKLSVKASDTTDHNLMSISECDDCAFAWQFPIVRTTQDSKEHFQSSYANPEEPVSSYFNPNRKRKIAVLELNFLNRLPVDGHDLLDVGAGAGIFAEVAMENGWEVTAIDPALNYKKSKKSNIKWVKGTLKDFEELNLYNVVTLWDVIEHSINPIELIVDVKKFLKKNGWLVLETANYLSVDRIIGGRNHWIYQFDHRWYFSPNSIKNILKKMGFTDFLFSETVLRPNWNGNIDFAGPSRLHLIRDIIRKPQHIKFHLSKFANLKKAKDWEMSGLGIFTVAARKP